MTTTRRGFLAAILAAGAAPAIVRVGSIMRIAPPTGWVIDGNLLVRGSITADRNLFYDEVPWTLEETPAQIAAMDLERRALTQFAAWSARHFDRVFAKALEGHSHIKDAMVKAIVTGEGWSDGSARTDRVEGK